MKNLAALLAALASCSFVLAAESAKAKATEKPKAEAKTDLDACCDDDAKPADSKTAKATEQKSDAAKKDAPKPIAKSDKK